LSRCLNTTTCEENDIKRQTSSLLLAFQREVFTEIQIHAKAATVWSILVDLSIYHLWNPFIVQSKGEVRVGERLECRPRLPGSKRTNTFHPVVTKVVAERVFAWKGHTLVPGLADGEHIFEIEPLERGGVRLVHRQEFSGLLIPLFVPFYGERIRQGFEQMNEALKERAEARASRGMIAYLNDY
jgi:hypothetical protein